METPTDWKTAVLAALRRRGPADYQICAPGGVAYDVTSQTPEQREEFVRVLKTTGSPPSWWGGVPTKVAT